MRYDHHNHHNHHIHQNNQHHHCQHHHPPLPTCTRAIVEWCSPSFSLRPPGNRDPTTVPHAAGAHMAQALLLICSYGTFVRKGLKQKGLRQYRKFLTSLKTAHNGNAQTKKNDRTHILKDIKTGKHFQTCAAKIKIRIGPLVFCRTKSILQKVKED